MTETNSNVPLQKESSFIWMCPKCGTDQTEIITIDGPVMSLVCAGCAADFAPEKLPEQIRQAWNNAINRVIPRNELDAEDCVDFTARTAHHLRGANSMSTPIIHWSYRSFEASCGVVTKRDNKASRTFVWQQVTCPDCLAQKNIRKIVYEWFASLPLGDVTNVMKDELVTRLTGASTELVTCPSCGESARLTLYCSGCQQEFDR